jgi:hypothetical protein
MTNKDKKMADIYLAEPVNKTEAYSRSHVINKGTKVSSIHQQASAAFRKPQVLNYLAKYSDTAEQGLIEVVEASKKYALQGGRDGSAYAGTAVSGYNSIIDRVHGKATQRTEVSSQHVILTLDLTDEGTDQT